MSSDREINFEREGFDVIMRGALAGLNPAPPAVETPEVAHPFPYTGEGEHTAYHFNHGPQHRFVFANGYGASVIQNEMSYGHDLGLWELAVTRDGGLCYSTPITDDVIGRLTEQDVADLLVRIAAL